MSDKNNLPQGTVKMTSVPVKLKGLSITHLDLAVDSNNFVVEIDPVAMEQVSRTMATINERLADVFSNHAHEADVRPKIWQNPLNKCQDCVWFHKGASFCAVAPKNLTSVECGDRQIPEPSKNLDYLEARSPERIALIQNLAQKLEMEPETIEQKLFQGWLENNEVFGLTTFGLLSEIEIIGAYSIAQMELIRDGIKLNANAGPWMVASKIKVKILTGCKFDNIMRFLLLVKS